MTNDHDRLLDEANSSLAARIVEETAKIQQGMRRRAAEIHFNYGTLYAKEAFAASNAKAQARLLERAVDCFQRILAPEYDAPDAAFSLGMIAEHLGDEVKAAGYFEQAAAMPRGLNPEQDAPTQAMLKLATYALHGRGGMVQDAAVAQDWIARAQARHPDLFMNEPAPSRPARKLVGKDHSREP